MELIPYVVAYVAIGIFVIALAARFMYWQKMPMHVRWELYPVAHEGKRVHYGGSYLEEVDWWKKEREVDKISELKEMLPEMLFLVALREHNRKLWIRSLAFHGGIYLIIGGTFLMFAYGVMARLAPTAVQGGLGMGLQYLCVAFAGVGLVVGLLGAVALLVKRLTDPDLKDFTAPADLFNLVFFIVAFGVALASIAVDPDMSTTLAFMTSLITFTMAPMAATSAIEVSLATATVVLLGALVAYIPMTHMSHFVGKWFSYHEIRWKDAPNLKGGPEEEAIGVALNRPVSWAAAHINSDGSKSWADVATEQVKK